MSDLLNIGKLSIPNISVGRENVSEISLGRTKLWPSDACAVGYIILKTSSESEEWSPSEVVNTGATLHWEVTGAATYSVDADSPVFDFSAPGEKVITITSDDDFGGLQVLDLGSNQLTSFDATGLTGLGSLNLRNNQITSFDATGLTGLQYLYLSGNQLTSFDATGLTGLQELDLGNNQLTSFDATGLTGLQELYLSGNQLTSFDVTGLTGLQELDLNNNQLTSFDATGLTGLQYLDLNNNQLTLFDATGLTGLQQLRLDKNQLTSFDATGLTGLEVLNLDNNQFTTVAINILLDQLITIGNPSGSWLSLQNQVGGGCGDPAKIAALDSIWGTVLVDACPSAPTYPEVTIGTQTWRSVNLDVDDGLGGIYAYDNNEANVATYGRLYTWDAAMRVAANIDGWHLPSDAEWTTLTTYLGGESVAGGKLKETGTTHWASPNTGATNETGFTALPGGYRDDDGTFLDIGDNGYWWSATEHNADYTWDRDVYYDDSSVGRNYSNKEAGFSVRLIKDYSHTPNITLVGDNPVTISVGDTYTDAGATAYDTRYGDITSDIVVVNNVNTSVDGTYTVTYNITTEDGYSAEEVVRTVVVELALPQQNWEEVTIDTQTWMKYNLVIDDGQGGIYSYNNDIANAHVYGYLYTWDAAVRVAASIDGWHLPSDEEWTTLATYLGGTSVAGGKLKEAGTTHWASPNTGATNEVGFTALGGGKYSSNIRSYGWWWTSSTNTSNLNYANTPTMVHDDIILNINSYHHKSTGVSVRLIKNTP